jgi:RimJ/RimL family protein N-acetyltransferase
VRAKIWDTAALTTEKSRLTTKYTTSPTHRSSILLLVSLNDVFVGLASIFGYGERKGNIGLQLVPTARGRGIGKVTLELLFRLSCELDVDEITMGTMKSNVPMRGLAKSLGLVEKEEEMSFPGYGVVVEIMWKGIPREQWKDFGFEVDFLESGPMDFAE